MKQQLMDSRITATLALFNAMTATINDGEPSPKSVAELLAEMTRRDDTELFLTDRQLRRLKNSLAHHSQACAKTLLRLFETFSEEIEIAGLHVDRQFHDPDA